MKKCYSIQFRAFPYYFVTSMQSADISSDGKGKTFPHHFLPSEKCLSDLMRKTSLGKRTTDK